MDKQFGSPLEGTLIHRIAVKQTIRILNITRVPLVLFDDVRFHRAFAVITKVFFCWWWVHISQNVNFLSVLPNYCGQTSLSPRPYVTCFQSQLFRSKIRVMFFLLGHIVPHEFILCLSKSTKSLGDKKKLSINILCPKSSTLLVKCLTIACVAVMSSVVECESLPKYTLTSYVYPGSSDSL